MTEARKKLRPNAIVAQSSSIFSGQTSALVALVVKILGAVASFGVTFLIAAEFGAEVIGVYALFTQTIVALSMFAVFGNDQVIVRGVAGSLATGHEAAAKRIVLRATQTTMMIAGPFALLSLAIPPLGLSLGFPDDLSLALALGMLANAGLVLGAALLRGTHRVVVSQFFGNLVALIMCVSSIMLPLVEIDDPATVLSLAYTFVVVLTAGLCLLLALRIVLSWTNKGPDDAEVVNGGQFQLGAISTLNFAVGWAILVSVGLLFGQEEAGVFRVCLQFNTLLLMIIFTYNGTISPAYAKLYALGDYHGMRRLLIQSQIVLTVLCALPAVIILIFAGDILSLMGEEFRSGATTLRLLILAAICVAIAGSGGSLLNMAGQERIMLQITVVGAIAQIALVAVGAATLGMEAAAWSYLLSFALRFWAAYFVAQRYISQQIATA